MPRFSQLIGPFGGGILFALGLGFSGMLEPVKIIGFLDIFGAWDPTLLYVMLGAVTTHMLLFRLIIKRPTPLYDDRFYLPVNTRLDLRLISGAILFGVGWALSGLCPGPGLVSLVSGQSYALIFVLTMLVGFFASRLVTKSH